MIQANCRARLTPGDLEFLVAALTRRSGERVAIEALTTDPEGLDRLLDEPRLFRALLEAPSLLRVSPWFFYYVVVRRAFLEHGIEPRRVADYVGALLAYHLQRRGDYTRGSGGVYLVDLVAEIAEARTEDDAFSLRTRIGNVALFLSGVFPDWVYHRHVHGRRPVGLSYYEQMGSRFWREAAEARAAARYDLGDVLAYMADRFPQLRQALNDLVDDHLTMYRRPEKVDQLFRQAIFRTGN